MEILNFSFYVKIIEKNSEAISLWLLKSEEYEASSKKIFQENVTDVKFEAF